MPTIKLRIINIIAVYKFYLALDTSVAGITPL
nr:MAG TPA: hypothetical protein [Bacteriophage sp.]